MFDMDTDHGSSAHSRDRHGDAQSQAASSTCGELSSVDCALDRRGSIDMCRRAVPVIEAEADDICSICLDEFTQEDPGMPTVCGYEIGQQSLIRYGRFPRYLWRGDSFGAMRRHQYHLQCIMQWAQRSRECPMCFKALQLQVDSNLIRYGRMSAATYMLEIIFGTCAAASAICFCQICTGPSCFMTVCAWPCMSAGHHIRKLPQCCFVTLFYLAAGRRYARASAFWRVCIPRADAGSSESLYGSN